MSEGRPIVVDVQLTPRGYGRVLWSRAMGMLRFAAPAVAFFGTGALATGRWTVAAWLLGSLIFLLAAVWGYVTWATRSPMHASLFEPAVWEFFDGGIVSRQGDEERILAWEDVTRWEERAEHLLLWVSGGRFVPLPLAKMSTADQDGVRLALERGGVRGPRARRRGSGS